MANKSVALSIKVLTFSSDCSSASSACLRSVMSSAAHTTYSTFPSLSSLGVLEMDDKRSSPLPFLTHSSVRTCLFDSKTSLLPAMQTSASSLLRMSYIFLYAMSLFCTPKNSARALFTAPWFSKSVRYQICVSILSSSIACSSDTFRRASSACFHSVMSRAALIAIPFPL